METYCHECGSTQSNSAGIVHQRGCSQSYTHVPPKVIARHVSLPRADYDKLVAKLKAARAALRGLVDAIDSYEKDDLLLIHLQHAEELADARKAAGMEVTDHA